MGHHHRQPRVFSIRVIRFIRVIRGHSIAGFSVIDAPLLLRRLGLAEQLAMLALRRTMTFDDRAALARIAAAGKAHDDQLRALVEALVLSDFFQKQ